MTSKPTAAFLTPELICSNIKMSLYFYTQILGFNIQYERKEEGFAMLERQGSYLMLDEIKNPAGKYRSWISAPLEAPFGRGINLQIKTTHVGTLYDHVTAMGVSIFLPIETTWYRANHLDLGLRQFIVLDPDGYMLRFAELLDVQGVCV